MGSSQCYGTASAAMADVPGSTSFDCVLLLDPCRTYSHDTLVAYHSVSIDTEIIQLMLYMMSFTLLHNRGCDLTVINLQGHSLSSQGKQQKPQLPRT